MNLTRPFAHYPHIKKAGPFVFISGQGCRDPESNAYLGTTIEDGQVTGYDPSLQTAACLKNVERALAAIDLRMTDLVDVTVFLKDMADFDAMNAVWNDSFPGGAGPARTTVGVKDLPGHNCIEIKAIACITDASSNARAQETPR